MTTDTIELSLGDFTAMKIDRLPNGQVTMTPMDCTFYQELIDRGWRVSHSYDISSKLFGNKRTVVILERRPR